MRSATVVPTIMGCATLLAAASAGGCAAAGARPAPLAAFTETIPGTAVSFEMVPVGEFWIGRTEVTWDAYDVFIYGLDRRPDDTGPDAVTRPSKPYISMDRGFGHGGYPAISMSFRGATAFCEWLSAKTGRRYRLPTDEEWLQACSLGAIDPAGIDRVAWHRGNSDLKTHPVASREPDAAGLCDLAGNAAEWCTGPGGMPVALGGCYRDAAGDVGCAARALPSEQWNRSDPQIPKSQWWLADAGFVGFRVVCEPQAKGGGP